MDIKALLIDFDETLVDRDVMSELVAMTGKRAEAERLALDFQTGKTSGVEGLIARINMITGMATKDIQTLVKKDLGLAKGARELVRYCQDNGILVILASGSIYPVLEVYERELGLDYIVCSMPQIKDGMLNGISETDYPQTGKHFKVDGIERIIAKHGIDREQCIAVGDGRGDIPMFEMAGYCAAINPKGGIEEYADTVVDDLFGVKRIVEGFLEAKSL